MQLSLQNFSALVETMAAAVQGAAQPLLDLTEGSVLRAILQANASIALWLQWLIVQVLGTTRLATSTGVDCDSFGADFGFARLPAVAASGAATFARFTPSAASFIPAGTNIATTGNTQNFVVVADPTNAAYDPVNNGYDLAAGLVNVTVPIVANAPGSAGNVQPGAIGLLSSAVAGVDTVTNVLALTGGLDAETDAAFKLRFGNYLASLARATDIAIGAAISAVQQGLSYTISENIDQTGAPQPGHFVVTVDNGTGAPPESLLQTVQLAVDAVRPVGSSFAVQGPVVLAANISMIVATASPSSHQNAVSLVTTAIETYVASLGIGAALNYTRLAQLAYDASAAVLNVSAVLLNGETADLAPPLFGVVRSGTVTVS